MIERRDDTTPVAVAQTWLDALAVATGTGVDGAVGGLFVDDCWWRDLLSLTWDFRTFHGLTEVRDLVAAAGSSLGRLALRASPPPVEMDSAAGRVVQAQFTFETGVARGRGVVSLVAKDDGGWRARTVFTFM